MSACPNCGAIPRANDKYCNTCGTPVASPQGAPPGWNSPPAYGAPPQPPVYGNPQQKWDPPAPPARCQAGHEIAPGQNYCPQGHPIALEGVQFAGNPQQQVPYGGQPPVYPGGGPGYGAAQYPGGYAPQAPQGYSGGAPYAASPSGQAYAPAPYAPQGQLPGYTPPPPPQPQEPSMAAAPQARVLRGFLVSFQTNPQGDFWPLHSGRLTVGRSNSGEALDVPLADATISSRHAIFTSDPGGGPLIVEDSGSTNGTFVNDEHIGFNGRRELRDGDRVRFGGYTGTVKIVLRT